MQPTFFRRTALAIALALSAIQPALSQSETIPHNGATEMKVRDLYPLITTPALKEVRDFYLTHFKFQVAFEANWFVYLVGPGEDGSRGATLAFMHPDHPSVPPGPETFNGLGMILTVEVSDAASVHERLQGGGAPIVHPLTDEKWGQRRFMTRDPAGVLVDVVEQIEPAAGFWDPYMVQD
jgi:catechol 2,3-dioxygenase-like lactoylglutathione lyase family enzyme